MDNPSPGLSPTNADIYRAIGRLEAMVYGLPRRVSSLERSRAWCLGVFAVIGAGAIAIFKGTSSS